MQVFDADREAVLKRAAAAGVSRILVPSLNRASALRAIELAEANTGVFAAVGIHPTEIEGASASDLAGFRNLGAHPKVAGVGEVGLDYHRVIDDSTRRAQREVLVAHLELAQDIQRPVVLHMREEADGEDGRCSQDMLAILDDWMTALRAAGAGLSRRPGVLHSFSGSLETALRAIDLGFCIGVTGPVTFPNAERRRQLVRRIPLDHLLIETDAPYLAPVPHRGRRNEPAFVTHIADKIAQIQSRTINDVAAATSDNAARVFGWGVSA